MKIAIQKKLVFVKLHPNLNEIPISIPLPPP